MAAAIDLVRRELIETDDEPLSDEANFAWDQAVMHNFHDCFGMRELMIICGREAPRVSEEAQAIRRKLETLLGGSDLNQ